MIKKILKKVKGILTPKEQAFNFDIDKKLISDLLPADPVIIDCGAHMGTDALEFAKIPGSQVHCFEPVSDIYRQLVENTKDFKNVHCYNLALNDFDGEIDMYVSSGYSDGSSSILKPLLHLQDHPDVFFDKTEKVRCLKLDTWAAENNINAVDMLWLDMQGAEHQMLSASKIIFPAVKIIHCEVTKHESYEGVMLYPELKKFMKQHNFYENSKAFPKKNYGGNVLFVRK